MLADSLRNQAEMTDRSHGMRGWKVMQQGMERNEGTVVDGHIHLVGTGDSGSGCRMPKAYRWSRAYAEMLGMLGLSVHEATDDRIAEAVIDTLDHASHIKAGVVLALDETGIPATAEDRHSQERPHGRF